MQCPHLEFESGAFPVTPGEDERTNPGIYGKALAEWLKLELRSDGLATGNVIAEDFGWCVPIKASNHSVYVVCASFEDGSKQWHVFAFAEGALLARLFGKDPRGESLSRVYGAVRQRLEAHPDVRNLREISDYSTGSGPS